MKTTEFLILRMLTHFIKMGTFILFLFSFMFQSCQKDIIDTYSEPESSQENVLKSAAISGESINALILKIQELSDEGSLDAGLANALIKKLESAIVNLEKGKDKVAANLLNAVLNQLESLVGEGVIDSETGDDLMADTHEALGDLSFTDPRDGTVYQTIIIGDQCWMAENLAYLPEVKPLGLGSVTVPHYYVYDYYGTSVEEAKARTNYNTYGVLYNWPAALIACPSGWHLPTDDEWKQLEMFIGMSQEASDEIGYRGTNEGSKLKTTSGWSRDGNGTDDFGFSALPGGYRLYIGYSNDMGYHAHWWSSTDYYGDYAMWRHLHCDYSTIFRYNSNKALGYSVRCIKD